MRGPRARPPFFLAALVLLATLGFVKGGEPETWSMDDVGLGTWETCDTCDMCLLTDVPVGTTPPKPAPGADGKTHCTRCLGCNVVLARLDGLVNSSMLTVEVKASVGRSGAAILAGETKDWGSVIVKAYCGVPGGYKQFGFGVSETPDTCKDTLNTHQCVAKSGTIGFGRCNYDFLSALDQIAVDANLTRVVGRSKTTKLRSFLPVKILVPDAEMSDDPEVAKLQKFDDGSGGVKLADVSAQMFKRSFGVPLVELYSGGARLTPTVWGVTKKINHDSVFAASFWDFMVGETDRHGENVLLDDSLVPSGGQAVIRLIDNDGALKIGPTDAVSSFLVPGTKWWRVLRNTRYGHERMCCVKAGLRLPSTSGTSGPQNSLPTVERLLRNKTHSLNDSSLTNKQSEEIAKSQPDPGAADKADACGVLGDAEPLGPESLFDPRCHVHGKFIGTKTPSAKTTQWLREVVENSTAQVMGRYPGLIDPKRVHALKRRAGNYLTGGYEYALLREFARTKMLDCVEDDVDSQESSKESSDLYDTTLLSPFRWRLNEPCCSLAAVGTCNAVRVKDIHDKEMGKILESETEREIFPNNRQSDEYEKLHAMPVEIASPRNSFSEETSVLGNEVV